MADLDPESTDDLAGGAAAPPEAPATTPPPVSSDDSAAVFPWQSCNRDAQRMVVIGATGSGKTTKAIQLVSEAIAGGALVVWWDTKGLNDPGLPAFAATAITSSAVLAALLAEHKAIAVQLDPYGDDDPQLQGVMQACYELGNLLLVIDDAMGVLTTKAPKWLGRVITQGRARGIGVMSIVQRAAWVPRILLSEAEHVVAFELHDVDDIDTLARVCNRSLESARDLQRWHYLWYSRDQRRAVACAPLAI